MIRLMIVDDHAAVRVGLTALLDGNADIEVVGTCADGVEVGDAAARLCPDVILMDLSMAEMGGIEATGRVRSALPGVSVVVLTSSIAGSEVHESMAAGAAGFVLKPGHPDDLVAAVRAVAAGGPAWCPEAQEALRHAGPGRG